ncbi:ribosomal protein S15 [Bacteriovorax sp. BSW11_IV]|uniref:30S ribosomal protein S15 n=1 Tax=Bacteriovorax sp. BSW11_IV TaxID=1353529 RepID=UPI000389E0D9|nr:30S ribosomal protein S15 [Bacteriovorax sp. BSW11_IV]EQC48447.1 ribosomal protein S15 [Bacteriovorax sp. BSW11_IV]
MTTTERQQIVNEFGTEFGKGPKDSGCTAVQVALLTARINGLKGHFESHKHDYHSNRGLLKMIGQRKSLLKYLQNNNEEKYKNLINKLGLRK